MGHIRVNISATPSEVPSAPATKKVKTGVKVSDVAREAGVSATAVYSLLSGHFYGNGEGARIGLAPTTRSRIRKAAAKLGFLPTDLLSQVRLRPDLGGFTMLLSDSVSEGIGNPYFSRIFQGLSEYGASSQRSVSFATFLRKVDYMASPHLLPDTVRSGLTNKVVVAGDVNYSLLLALRRSECATVYASRDLGIPEVPGVVPDYLEAARLAITHLAGLGHRCIAMAAAAHVNTEAYYFQKLTEGSEKTWRDLEVSGEPPQFVFPDPQNLQGHEYLRSIFRACPKATAIFCFDDFSAIDLLNSATSLGLKVPEQLSIMGCNDESRPFMSIPLDTIHFPKRKIGCVSAQLLDKLLANESGKPLATITLPVELKVRASCSVAPDQVTSARFRNNPTSSMPSPHFPV